jgi:hypothetical protein
LEWMEFISLPIRSAALACVFTSQKKLGEMDLSGRRGPTRLLDAALL